MTERRKSIAETAPEFTRVLIATPNELTPSNPIPSSDARQSLSQDIAKAIQQDVTVTDGLVTVGFGNSKKITGNDDSRVEFEVGVKLFLMDYDPKFIHESLVALDSKIDCMHLDLFVLSAPILSEMDGKSFRDAMNILKHSWMNLEERKARGEISRLGISDLDLWKFTEFLKCVCDEPVGEVPHLDVLQIASPWEKATPSSVGGLGETAKMDSSFLKIAKQHNITVLTHHDPSPIITNDQFAELLGLEGGIRVEWVLRYTVLVKNRGVLSQRGYIVSAVKL